MKRHSEKTMVVLCGTVGGCVGNKVRHWRHILYRVYTHCIISLLLLLIYGAHTSEEEVVSELQK